MRGAMALLHKGDEGYPRLRAARRGRMTPVTTVNSRVYRDGVLFGENLPRPELEACLGDASCLVLIDFVAPEREDLSWVAEKLHLHPVAVTDAFEPHTRPKLERYETHDFLYCYFLHFDVETDALLSADFAFFFAGNTMVSVHQKGNAFFDRLTERIERHSTLAEWGVFALVWGVLDAIVDSHFDSVQQMDERLDDLEGVVFEEDHAPDVTRIQRELFAARKDLVQLRRLTLPMREIVNAVLRDEQDRISTALRPYFSDVYDHTLRVNEWVDSSRDLVTSLLDASLTIQGNRMNLIMKKVTSWAAIIAVPTLITGFFGQNVAFFGFGDAAGLVTSLSLIVVSSLGLYWSFRRNDWL